nr:MAG TPA_asm: hypothetical protein [Caudoviricetes sp.]DAU72000.1 MAG TPA: hypothetical protein [Caudoviricetes sp.]
MPSPSLFTAAPVAFMFQLLLFLMVTVASVGPTPT